jgi:WD40 repeat protein
VVALSADLLSLRAHDARDGHALGPPIRFEEEVRTWEVSPDGRRVATAHGLSDTSFGHDSTLEVHDLESGAQVGKTVHFDDAVLSLAFDAEGRRLASGRVDGDARVWDAATLEPLSPPLPNELEVLSVGFSPDGRRLVTGCGSETNTDRKGSATIWSLDQSRAELNTPRFDGGVRIARFSRDGTAIACVGGNGETGLFDSRSGLAISPRLVGGPDPRCLVFSPDGQRLLEVDAEGKAFVWAVGGDADEPADLAILEAELWVGARMDESLQLRRLSPEEYQERRARWAREAQAHARTCRYPAANFWLARQANAEKALNAP